MTIQLPILPQGSQTDITISSYVVDLKPTQGAGPTTRATRMGERWIQKNTLREMTYAQGIGFIATLIQGLSSKVRCPVEQSNLVIGSPGSPLFVSGSGASISASGFTSGYVIQTGQFFNIVHGGVYYLHMATASVTASGGSATIPIFPMLKMVPTGGDTLVFDHPQIEGFLDGNTQAWTISRVQSVGLSFQITEAQ